MSKNGRDRKSEAAVERRCRIRDGLLALGAYQEPLELARDSRSACYIVLAAFPSKAPPPTILLPGAKPQQEGVPVRLTVLNSSLHSLDPAEADPALLRRLAGLLASGVEMLTEAAAKRAAGQ